ncbi:MAG: putative acetyltransferase [Symbiobacteriaceae bacterium]|jgi:GNAT superfamily N-acetyltransferase|nr:putative acetyltransferase [Symbiobacteriaceae bacterium]
MYVVVGVPVTEADHAWLRELWVKEWGGEIMVSRGRVYHLDEMQSLLAWDGETLVGAATYHIADGSCELMSINATVEGKGVGSLLLAAVEDAARAAGCGRVMLITSNDNLDALRFYQRKGYRLVAVHAGAIDEARRIKPSIPLVGNYGIPLHDELELAKPLGQGVVASR